MACLMMRCIVLLRMLVVVLLLFLLLLLSKQMHCGGGDLQLLLYHLWPRTRGVHGDGCRREAP